jgi:acetyltransferase-like isoleucine patch superfamily enzyme
MRLLKTYTMCTRIYCSLSENHLTQYMNLLARVFVGMKDEVSSLEGILLFKLSIISLLVKIMPDFALVRTRTALYRRIGLTIGAGVTVHGRLRFVGRVKDLSKIRIGSGCIVGPDVAFGLDAPITIGDKVALGPGVTLCTATHAIGFGSRRMNPHLEALPIVIENGAWICINALILPGVTIGKGAVVGPGSIVTEDVPPHTLVQGNPATVQEILPFANR